MFCVLFCSIVITGFGQENQLADTIQTTMANPDSETLQAKKVRKNTIMVNVTNPSFISLKFFTVGYERVLTNNQSFTVSAGSFSIPQFTEELMDSLGINSDYKDKGFHFSADYRFYLKKYNKFDPPLGLYIGPYYAYNSLKREVNWYLDYSSFSGDVLTDIKLNINTVGFEMGYQFIFWDRMTVDMILFGPGFGTYKLETILKTNLTPDEESEFFDKLNNYFEEHIPGYDKVIDSGEFKRNGSYKTWDLGYRYSVRVGFRF
jgi:hypothetical protein